jgi:Zn-dependent M28 family amino/carboxypeptidase
VNLPRWPRPGRGSLLAVAALIALSPDLPHAAPPAPPAPLPAAVRAAASGIAGTRLHADVAFLADDMLEGRATGTRGYDLAAAYVAARMAALGLEPAGDSAFYQRVPMRRAVVDPAASSLALERDGTERPLALGADALLSPDFLRGVWTTEAPLVFAGYGVSAPEMGHDDFANLDVRGKVLVEFRGAPPRFPHNERAYYSNQQVKEQAAAAHGAIGILVVLKSSDEARIPWERSARQGVLPGYRWTDEGGAPANVQATLELGGRLSPSGTAAVFAGAARTFDEAVADAESSVAGGFELPGRVRARVVTRHSPAASPNVIGLLRGSDPKLAREAIVFTAHLDHLGISAPVDGDSINNGAYDNASGTAMLLEVARAFTRAGVRPKRSILFAAVTGEEKGLQGSDYLARHAGPAGLDVVGNLNLDEVLMLRPLTHIVAFGAEHSSLGPLVERAAALESLAVVPDPVPEEVVFVRSDQFSFVRQGVPGIFPVSAADGSSEGFREILRWDQDRYHSPGDDMSQVFDWEGGARFTRMMFLAGWLVADAPQAPRWNDGDFFGKRFGPRK